MPMITMKFRSWACLHYPPGTSNHPFVTRLLVIDWSKNWFKTTEIFQACHSFRILRRS